MDALMKGLPATGLQPLVLAIIDGLGIDLLEPPLGQRVAYIEPVGALTRLQEFMGAARPLAEAQALERMAHLREHLPASDWVNFLDTSYVTSADCVPLTAFIDCLRQPHPGSAGISVDILDYLETAGHLCTTTAIFQQYGGHGGQRVSLHDLAALGKPVNLIEFMPAPAWLDDDPFIPGGPFTAWYEAMKHVAHALEQRLGEYVYYFADPDCELDDDFVHRFLVMHWCCSYQPASAYVQYLLRISGAADVEALKAALIDPRHYARHGGYREWDTHFLRLKYVPRGAAPK
ncbi:hypothetical protein [Pseudomonas sp. NPDC007930]|uniref:hypothetical protein n=1 Tax=Pseudomonas sp. NPDC007930 TaxID=3364417 RepID=UPI0036E80F68